MRSSELTATRLVIQAKEPERTVTFVCAHPVTPDNPRKTSAETDQQVTQDTWSILRRF